MSFCLPDQIFRAALINNQIFKSNKSSLLIQKCQKIDTKKFTYLALKTNIKKLSTKSKRHLDILYREKCSSLNVSNILKTNYCPLKPIVVSTYINRKLSNRTSNDKSKSENCQEDDEYLTPLERFLKKYKKELEEIEHCSDEEKARLKSFLMRKEYKCDATYCIPKDECSPTEDNIENTNQITPKKHCVESCKKQVSSPPPRADDFVKTRPPKRLQTLDEFSNHNFKNKDVRPGIFCEKIRIMKQRCSDEEYHVFPPAGRYDIKLIGMKVKPLKEGYCCYEPCKDKNSQTEKDDEEFYNESYKNRQRRTDRKKCINAFGLQCIDPCLPKLVKKYDDNAMLYEHQDETDLRLKRLRPKYSLDTDTEIIQNSEELPENLPKSSKKTKTRCYSTYTLSSKRFSTRSYSTYLHIFKTEKNHAESFTKKSMHSPPNLLAIIAKKENLLNDNDKKPIRNHCNYNIYNTKPISNYVGGACIFHLAQNMKDNLKFVRLFGTSTSKLNDVQEKSQDNEQNKYENTEKQYFHANSDFAIKLNELQPSKVAAYRSFSDMNLLPSPQAGENTIEKAFHKYHLNKENANAIKLATQSDQYSLPDANEENLNLSRKVSEHDLKRDCTRNLKSEETLQENESINEQTEQKSPQTLSMKQSTTKRTIKERIKSYVMAKGMRREFSTSLILTSCKKDDRSKCGKLKKMFYVNPKTRTLNLKKSIEPIVKPVSKVSNKMAQNRTKTNQKHIKPPTIQPKSLEKKKKIKLQKQTTFKSQPKPLQKPNKFKSKSTVSKKRNESDKKKIHSKTNNLLYDAVNSSVKIGQNNKTKQKLEVSQEKKITQSKSKNKINELKTTKNYKDNVKDLEKSELNEENFQLMEEKAQSSKDQNSNRFKTKQIRSETNKNLPGNQQHTELKKDLTDVKKIQTGNNNMKTDSKQNEIVKKIRSIEEEKDKYTKHSDEYHKLSELTKKKKKDKQYETYQKQLAEYQHRKEQSQKRYAANYSDFERFDIIHNQMKQEDTEFEFYVNPPTYEKYKETNEKSMKCEKDKERPQKSNSNKNILKIFKLKSDFIPKPNVKKFHFKPDDKSKIINEPNLLSPNRPLDEGSIKSHLKIINEVLEKPPRREVEQKNYILTSKIPQLKKTANIYINKKNNNSHHVIAQETKLDDVIAPETKLKDISQEMKLEAAKFKTMENDTDYPTSSEDKFRKYTHVKKTPSQYLAKKIRDRVEKTENRNKNKIKKNKIYTKKILLKKIDETPSRTSRKYSTQKIATKKSASNYRDPNQILSNIDNQIDNIERELIKAKDIHSKIINNLTPETENEYDENETKPNLKENLEESKYQKEVLIKNYSKQIDEILKAIQELKKDTNEASSGYDNLTPCDENLKWDAKGEDIHLKRRQSINRNEDIITHNQHKKIQIRNLTNKFNSCQRKNRKVEDDCEVIEDHDCDCEKMKLKSTKKKRPTLFTKIVRYFKARPNCPTPQELKRKRLLMKAKKAADAAGLDICLKKHDRKYVCKKNSINYCEDDGGKRYHSTYLSKNTSSITSPQISPKNCFLYTQRDVYVGKMYEVKLSKIGVKNSLIPRNLEDEPYTYCQICKFVPRNLVKPEN